MRERNWIRHRGKRVDGLRVAGCELKNISTRNVWLTKDDMK